MLLYNSQQSGISAEGQSTSFVSIRPPGHQTGPANAKGEKANEISERFDHHPYTQSTALWWDNNNIRGYELDSLLLVYASYYHPTYYADQRIILQILPFDAASHSFGCGVIPTSLPRCNFSISSHPCVALFNTLLHTHGPCTTANLDGARYIANQAAVWKILNISGWGIGR